MAYRVKGALATYRSEGRLVYGYEGAVLPADVDPAEVDHLVDAGLVEEFQPDPEVEGKSSRSRAK